MVTWGAKTTLGDQTLIDHVTEEYLNAVTLATGLVADLQVEIDNESGSVTNGVQISIYTTLDDSTETWSDRPFRRWVHFPDGIAMEIVPVIVAGVYKFRLGFLAVAATDDYTVGGDYRVRTA